MAYELKIPEAGESITEVQIGQWLKGEGDAVDKDEVVVEIETDKASMELPSPVAGIVAKHLAQEGDMVAVGAAIALIEEREPQAVTSAAAVPAADKAHASAQATAAVSDGKPMTAGDPFVMPAARRALAESGLQPSDVQATGPGNRLLKEDVLHHRAKARTATEAVPSKAGEATDDDREEEVVPMSMLRRRIAQRLVDAQHTAAMLTTFNEIDMSAVMSLRKQRGEAFEKKHGVKLGIMSFFVKAAIDALKLMPAVNAEIRDSNIVYKNYFDIGVAVSTDRGLVVPVIRNAERMSFAEVEAAVADLAGRARVRKITVEELQGGTFTITNGGVFGSLMATPIINPPQSAILGLHVIQDRPVARDGQVVIRPMMYVALTYDHRIVDGRESVTFLKRVKDCVEEPARMLIEI